MTLWTPDGEKEIKKDVPTEEATADHAHEHGPDCDHGDAEQELTPEQKEQAEQMAKQMAEAREQILGAPASTVLMNHAFGMYELAAIHLTADEPKLEEAKLAIDCLSSIAKELEGKLGEEEQTMKEALSQIQMVYVQRKEQLAKVD